MAQSPSHKFGQIIGDLIEAAIEPLLAKIARDQGLYLDRKHTRAARGGRRKVAWTDRRGNVHDLDYVFEKGGSEDVIGRPKAFIEIAWRRYTKHSRNKAQEIQGAIVPLAETYHDCHPFLGVVLAGAFTDGSLTQLASHGFSTLHFPYETVMSAFASVGIDAAFGEDTSDSELRKKVNSFNALSVRQRAKIATKLRGMRKIQIAAFLDSLCVALGRAVERIFLIPLHGLVHEVASATQAMAFLENFPEVESASPFLRYEIRVRYTNGDEVLGQFQEKAKAIDFLRTFV